MSLFTPLPGIIGGSLIGASASTLLIMNGEIMGISGLLSSTLLHPFESMKSTPKHWRLVFLASFLLTVNFYKGHVENALYDARLVETNDVPISSFIAHILGGFFVGLGTNLGNGCTTGHGVCGVSRLSKRSILATATFTACGMATAGLISPATPWAEWTSFLRTSAHPIVSSALGTAVTATAALWALLRTSADGGSDSQRKVYGSSLSGILLALGLSISGMTKKSKVHDFLDVTDLFRPDGEHDPTLIAVLCSAILVSMLGYEFVQGKGKVVRRMSRRMSDATTLKTPLMASDWSVPTSQIVDAKLLGGASLFGLGWGLTGLCPGPALYAAAAGFASVVCGWIPAFCVGSYSANRLKQHWEKKNKQKSV